MGFVARIFSPPQPQPAPPPPPPPPPVPAPQAAPQATEAPGRERLRGGAARRRGSGTILSGDAALGTTTGKTLLGA